MTIEELTAFYPRAYHMAEFGTWDSIKEYGLLSTSALLDLFKVTGDRRLELESNHRPKSETIIHPINCSSAVVRDQKVLRVSALEKCLSGATLREWYELLNGKTFFWVHQNRLIKLLKGREYRNRQHCVITVDTAKLLQSHSSRARLSPINSGSTIFRPVKRSPAIFYTISEFPFHDRRATRSLENTVVELAIQYSVPNIENVSILVEHWKGDKVVETVWNCKNAK
jgi:hypothetical protein